MSDILKYFQSRESGMVDAIREIVEIESPSFDAGQNRKVIDLIESWVKLTGLDVAIERIPAQGIGEHFIIRAFAGEGKPVFILGHTDTVHPIGTKKKNAVRVEGDKFYGPGIFDMKANIVLMLEALRYFAETGTRPARPITILLSCDEEVGSKTGKPLVEREAKDAAMCLVFEPSLEGAVKTGRKGTGWYNVYAHGIPAHAGLEPEKGASAILELSRQIEKLHTLNALELGTTVNVCTIKGGTATNVIPENAECSVDVRFTTVAEAKRIDDAIYGLTSFDPRVSLKIEGEINRPPMERTAEVVSLYEKARDRAASFGYDLKETQVGGASDGNFVAALGVPVLDGLGLAGAGAHTLNEYVIVSDIAKRATLVTMLLRSE